MINFKRASYLLPTLIVILFGAALTWVGLGLTLLAVPPVQAASGFATVSIATPILVPASTPTCIPWQIVSSPNFSQYDNELSDVEIIAPDDIWAVGYFVDELSVQTLTLHWDGNQWTRIPSPSPEYRNYLDAVAAVSSTDVWAVGVISPRDSGDRTLTMHWDGEGWKVVPSPHPGQGSDGLSDVAALPTGEVWAVGDYPVTGVVKTLTIRWDGTQWEEIPSPNPQATGLNSLRGISALSPH